MNEVVITLSVYPVGAAIILTDKPLCRIIFPLSQLRHIYIDPDSLAEVYIGDARAGGGHFSYHTRAQEVDELLSTMEHLM